MHAYHERLPGYNEQQILHDGCPECEQWGAVVYLGIGQLDHNNYARAVQRAVAWSMNGAVGMYLSECELPLLETLWAVWCQEETARRVAAILGGL